MYFPMMIINNLKKKENKYLAGNFHIYKTSQYDAIVSGSCNY